jgi:hypothetical protein
MQYLYHFQIQLGQCLADFALVICRICILSADPANAYLSLYMNAMQLNATILILIYLKSIPKSHIYSATAVYLLDVNICVITPTYLQPSVQLVYHDSFVSLRSSGSHYPFEFYTS